jgi:small subunit ribosomal protein S14
MAKKSMIAREHKRIKKVKQYDAKRRALKAIVLDPKASFEDKEAAQFGLQKLPRDSCPARLRNRCS